MYNSILHPKYSSSRIFMLRKNTKNNNIMSTSQMLIEFEMYEREREHQNERKQKTEKESEIKCKNI